MLKDETRKNINLKISPKLKKNSNKKNDDQI
jgi:hypothetical protein